MRRMNSEYSDAALIDGCIRRERKFQELLYQKYAATMYGICLSYAKDRDTAQDILQDGFIKVFEKIQTFNQTGSLEGWIKRVISHTAIDHYRRKSTLRNYVEFDQALEKSDPNGDALDLLSTEDVLAQVQKLPDGARVIFNLYALEGYTHKEISKKLEISEGTSKSQFNRARSLLQGLVKSLIA